MTAIVAPDCRYRASWSEAVAEFDAAGSVMHGSGLWAFDTVDTTEAGCHVVVAHLLREGDPSVPMPEDQVHSTYYWIVEADEFVGYLALRHALTPRLREDGGHIGFSVRPTRRRRGHARRALALALVQAGRLGLDRVLLTCDEDNVGSRLTIEANGGVHEDSLNGKRRYWIDVG